MMIDLPLVLLLLILAIAGIAGYGWGRWQGACTPCPNIAFERYAAKTLGLLMQATEAPNLPEEAVPSTHEDPLGQMGRRQYMNYLLTQYADAEAQYRREGRA